MENFEARNGNYETNDVVKNQGTKQREQRSLGDCWQWKANGQCSKGDNCSFRHDMNKRAKSTQPNLSPRSPTRQSVRNASRTRCPRGKSPSGRMSWLPCKDYLKGTCTTSFCEKWHRPECLFYKSEKRVAGLGQSALMRIARLMNNLAKSPKWMVTKVQWLCWKLHDNWVAYFKIWSRRSLHRFCGRAQTYGNQSDVFDQLKPWNVMLTFETKIHRLEWFAQVILITGFEDSDVKSLLLLSRVFESIAWNDLPRWSSSAQPQCPKIWGSVSRRDGKARAMCPWSSVEVGQKIYKN